MAKVRLKSIISSRFLGISRRRTTHLKSVAGASQDGGVSKWTRGSLELKLQCVSRWGSRLNTSPS
eukprot:1529068-Prymnesium_polylepis.1